MGETRGNVGRSWNYVGVGPFWVCKKSEYPPESSELCRQMTSDMFCVCSRGHCLNVLVRDVLGYMMLLGVL